MSSRSSESQKESIPVLDLQFYDDKKYGHTTTLFKPAEENKKLVRNFMKFILYGAHTLKDMGTLKWFFHPRFLRALLFKKNEDLLKALQDEYHFIFDKLLAQLAPMSPQVQNDHALFTNLFMYNLKSLYIFTEPKDEKALLPIYNFEQCIWEKKPCQLKKILLTNHPRLQTLLKPEDHVYCYAIIPEDDQNPDKYPVIITLMGTTTPTGQGISMQNMTNALPDYEIGQYLFEADIFGQNRILKLLSNPEYKNRQKILTGASLGGMLAQMYGMYLAAHNVSNIEVYAYNPATFFVLPTEKHPYLGRYFSKDTPKVMNTVVSQGSDPISGVGLILEDSQLIKTKFPSAEAKYHPTTERVIEMVNTFSKRKLVFDGEYRRDIIDTYFAHIVIHATHPGVQFERVHSVAEVNNDTVRREATVIAKEKLRPLLYERAKKDHPHLKVLPKLRPTLYSRLVEQEAKAEKEIEASSSMSFR